MYRRFQNRRTVRAEFAISKVFREIGLADELGSGMRNTYKFTKLYSGGVPQFIEGDVFKTVIPLNETATMKSGSKSSDQVSDQVGSIAVVEKILEFCKTARTKKEISEHIPQVYTSRVLFSFTVRDYKKRFESSVGLQVCEYQAFDGGIFFFGNRKLRTV